MITLEQVKENKHIMAYIKQSDIVLNKLNYTYHGLSHVNLVAKRAGEIAQTFGFSKRKIEYAKIAGFCHDMANFIGRNQHHYWGALLFNQIFAEKTDDLQGLTQIMHAIASHDKYEKELIDNVTAAVVIADKSDVHRNRVRIHSRGSKNLQNDIHDRVNFAVVDNHLILNKDKKTIELKLTVDRKMISAMDYFEIFIERMSYCKFSAQKIGCHFHLNINNFKLL